MAITTRPAADGTATRETLHKTTPASSLAAWEYDLPTELGDAQWQGYAATLAALAAAGGGGPDQDRARRELAGEVLQQAEELLVHEATLAANRVWRQTGRALVALGHPELWTALYALYVAEEGPPPDPRTNPDFADEAAEFLESQEAPVPDPPPGWPGRWLPDGASGAAPAPPASGANQCPQPGADALRAGLALGAQVAVACLALAHGHHPDGVHRLELYDVYPDDTRDEAAATVVNDACRAWEAALDTAAALPVPQLREGLAAVVRLAGTGAG